MNCCEYRKNNKLFNLRRATKSLRKYQAKGPATTTQILLDALRKLQPNGKTVLDIGGGVGVIQLELLKSGAATAVSIDASQAYISVAKEAAKNQGVNARITFITGDFVELDKTIEAADIVTLDRVICCYANMPSLVTSSSKHARSVYAVIYPHDTWWPKFLFSLINIVTVPLGLVKIHVHSTKEVEKIITKEGFKKTFHQQKGIWQIAVFQRDTNYQS